MAKLKYWTLLVSLAAGAHSADSPAKYSLAQVLSRVEAQNPMFASRRHAILAAQAQVKSARSLMPAMAGAGLEPDGAFRIELEQSFPGFGKLRAKARVLNSLAREAAEDSAVMRNELLAEAKLAYYERWIAERRRAVLSANAKPLKLLAQSSGSQVVYGRSSAGSVFKARARLARLEAMRVHEEGAVREASVMLNYLMGDSLDAVFDIDTGLSLKYYPESNADTAGMAHAGRRSSLRKMDQAIETMRNKRRQAGLGAMPDFGIKLENMTETGGETKVSLMAFATLPFLPWSSGEYRAETRAMDEQIRAMEREREDFFRKTVQDSKRTFLMLQSEYREVEKYAGEILPALEKNLELSLVAYEQNMGELQDALMAWDDLSEAQMEYLFHLETAFKVEAEYEKTIERP